jgi:hypothetical protein
MVTLIAGCPVPCLQGMITRDAFEALAEPLVARFKAVLEKVGRGSPPVARSMLSAAACAWAACPAMC